MNNIQQIPEISQDELNVIRKYAKHLGLQEIQQKKPRVKKQRTQEQIDADKLRMQKLREMKKKSA